MTYGNKNIAHYVCVIITYSCHYTCEEQSEWDIKIYLFWALQLKWAKLWLLGVSMFMSKMLKPVLIDKGNQCYPALQSHLTTKMQCIHASSSHTAVTTVIICSKLKLVVIPRIAFMNYYRPFRPCKSIPSFLLLFFFPGWWGDFFIFHYFIRFHYWPKIHVDLKPNWTMWFINMFLYGLRKAW